MNRAFLLILICTLLLAAACTPGDEPTAPATTESSGPSDVAVEAPTNVPPAATVAQPDPPSPVPTQSPEVVEGEEIEPVPEATEATETIAVPTPAPTNWPAELGPEIMTGRTDDGAYFIGAVDAPVTLIDYSDFL